MANVIQLRETCHSEAVTDVTAVGIRIQNVRENGLPRQSADWLAMTKPLTEWHWGCGPLLDVPPWGRGLKRGAPILRTLSLENVP